MKKSIALCILLCILSATLIPATFAQPIKQDTSHGQKNVNIDVYNLNLEDEKTIRIIHIRLFQKSIFMVFFPMICINGLVQWDFGDQNGQFARNIVTHSYAQPGSYTVTASFTTIRDINYHGQRSITI